MESLAEKRVHRRAKQIAVSEMVNKKITKTMKIARRANKKAQDNLLHRRSQDKEVNPKILSHSAFAQMQGDEDREVGEIPLIREQMHRARTLLQESVAEEQPLQKAGPAQRHTAIIKELSTERQARRLAERRVAELEE